jgi:hypothetical protein
MMEATRAPSVVAIGATTYPSVCSPWNNKGPEKKKQKMTMMTMMVMI